MRATRGTTVVNTKGELTDEDVNAPLREACALIMSATGFAQHYTQTNLVSNAAGVAPVTDPQLINPWGLSRNSGSPWWVSDQATGFSTLYNGAGAKQSLIVTIPPADPTNKNTPTGTPTGTIANGSQTDFCWHQANQRYFSSPLLMERLQDGIQRWG